MSYEATYTRPYEGGYKNLPSEDTVEMAEFINKRDDTLIKIEEYLASGQLALSERKIAGKDLTDDITAEELKEVLGVDALETDLDNAKVAIRNQGVVLKQTQNDVKERIKKFYTNNIGEQFSVDTDDGLVRDLIVGGVSEQFTTTGAQLLNLGDEHLFVNTDGSITDWIEYYSCTLNVENIDSVYVSGNFALLNSSLLRMGLSNEIPVAGGTAVRTSTGQNKKVDTSEYNYLLLCFLPNETNNVSLESIVSSFMVNYGDTALPWEPYTGGVASPNPEFPQEIKKTIVSEIKTHGKNLLKCTFESTTQNGIEISEQRDGGIRLKGTSLGNQINLLSSVNHSPVKENTVYTYKLFNSESTWKNIIWNVGTFNGDSSKTFSVTDASNINFSISIPEGVSVDKVIYPMLVLGEEVPIEFKPYIEHSVVLSEPIELNGIGDAQDKIIQKNGVYGIERVYEKHVFTGEEEIYNPNTGKGYYFAWDWKNIKASAGLEALANALCNKLVQQTPNTLWNNNIEGFTIRETANSFIFRLPNNVNIIDVTSCKELLKNWYNSGDPMYIVCEVVNSTFEPLPVADQIALKDLPTYYGGTYILSDSEVEATFDYNYPCSIENFVEYVKEQMGDTREFNYNMEQRITNEEYLSALAFVNSEYSIALTEMGV